MRLARPTPNRRRRTAALAVAAATSLVAISGVAVGPASAADSAGPAAKKLNGSVGPGFTISIDQTTVKAGKYKLVVNDKGTIHNFRITGPGVDKATSVPGTGKTTWKLKLKPGVYEIICDPHSGSMNITLTVT